MYKITIFIIIVFIASTSFAQSLSENINNVVHENVENEILSYCLFPTQNMWTFLKLNTRNGKIWQVHFDVNGNNRFETPLNTVTVIKEGKEMDNRFTLYSTQNSWTFILLDQVDGRTWQVQWSFDSQNRGIIPIE